MRDDPALVLEPEKRIPLDRRIEDLRFGMIVEVLVQSAVADFPLEQPRPLVGADRRIKSRQHLGGGDIDQS